MVRFVLVGHIKVLDQRKNSMPLIYTRVVPGATWNDLRGHHDHGAIGNYIVSDKPLTQEESEKLRAGPCLSGAVEIAAEVRDRPPLFIVTYSPKAPQKWPERTS